MSKKPSLKQKLQYSVDNAFANGTGTLIFWLAALSLVIIVVMAFLVSVLRITPDGEGPLSFWEAFWRSLMRTLDAGTMGADAGWLYRIAMLLVTIGGVFVISTLIGILSTAIQTKLEELRKGKSQVLESGHTVILGWTEQIFTILSELQQSNENQCSFCIVILSEKDKVEMEDEISSRLGTRNKTRIVCRSGSPIELENLSTVSVNDARSIIILSPREGEVPDAEVLKVILAILNHPDRKADPFHIVAEMCDPKNAEVAKIVGKDEVELVLTGEIISRIIAQTCRQSGLSEVYTELLDFGGDEIYVKSIPELTGLRYGEILNRFEKNTVMGLISANGTGMINPPMDRVISQGDRVAVIAEDDDKIVLDGKPEVDPDNFAQPSSWVDAKEETLLIGWNERAEIIIREMGRYAPKGSSVVVLTNHPDAGEAIRKLSSRMETLNVRYLEGNPVDRESLLSAGLGQFEHIILLSNSKDLSVQQSDAQTMISLLHLRDIAEKEGYNYSIVSEMLDLRNRNLAEIAHADDFIVSDKLISLLLAQVSESKALNLVFTDIFDPEGSEIYLKPVGQYVCPAQPVNFYTVVEAARAKGETAIGYRLAVDAKSAEKSYGIHLNPLKSEKVIFNENDKIIVLADA